MKENLSFGAVIHPCHRAYHLEASMLLHRLLVKRSNDERFRFRGTWVTSGPFESLIGRPGTGHGHSVGCIGDVVVPLHEGYQAATRQINSLIISALCSYPDLAMLRETISLDFVHCGDAVASVGRFEGKRTKEPLNQYHKRARVVRRVGVSLSASGVYLSADVTLSGSRWCLFQLADTEPPKWRKRERLATFLGRCEKCLLDLVER